MKEIIYLVIAMMFTLLMVMLPEQLYMLNIPFGMMVIVMLVLHVLERLEKKRR